MKVKSRSYSETKKVKGCLVHTTYFNELGHENHLIEVEGLLGPSQLPNARGKEHKHGDCRENARPLPHCLKPKIRVGQLVIVPDDLPVVLERQF